MVEYHFIGLKAKASALALRDPEMSDAATY
jgi:hypothetical protein